MYTHTHIYRRTCTCACVLFGIPFSIYLSPLCVNVHKIEPIEQVHQCSGACQLTQRYTGIDTHPCILVVQSIPIYSCM